MARNATVSGQILELFAVEEDEPLKRFTLRQLQDILDHLDPQRVKSAMERLRGQHSTVKRLRAVGYINQAGHGGKSIPVFSLGNDPDVPRTEAHTENIVADATRRARELRRRHEERRVLKELDAIDNYQ